MKKRYLYILMIFITIASCGAAIKAAEIFQSRTVKILSPAEMSKLADSFSAQEISQLEIDDVLRDRLRFDPQWQEIVQAIRQDIIITKWGKDAVANPAWKKYGAKAYPLLSYYARSRDETRQKYGIEGIRNLGKPYTTIWLRGQIQRRLTYPNLYEIAPYVYEAQSKDWEKDFGLDDPQVRKELISLAKANLEPKNSPQYYSQFNLEFLTRILGYEAVYGKSSYEKEKNFAGLPEWVNYEQLAKPTDSQIKAAISLYQKLPSDAQEYILVERLGAIKAGEITPFGRAFFHSLINEPNSNDRTWAIAELDRHGDAQATELLQNILNNDLSQLYPLSKIVSYENFTIKGDYAYYLLLGMVTKYPQSKFAIACREYGDLTGRSYFDGEPRSQEIIARNANRTEIERLQAWQDWLRKYPDHAGVDDANYFLALSLQNNNDIMRAMRLWNKIMVQPMGDRDAIYLAFPHVRTLLDVGLSIEQMQTLLQEPDNQPLAPLLQYAIAIQYARSHNYAKALEINANLNLDSIPDRILEAYYYPQGHLWREDNRVVDFKKEAQSLLSEQKLRWQKLRQWQIENTPESRYQIASDWAGIGGWKNGYLPIWDGFRTYRIPTDWDCDKWWVCDESKRSSSEILAKYQGGSQNAIAISLYQQLLDDQNIPLDIREKSLYMIGMTLLNQWENHTFAETQRIHPPAGLSASGQYRQLSKRSYSYQDYEQLEKSTLSDYHRRIDSIITELQIKFPQSPYIDDLLFSSFFLSEQPRYLQRLLERYPDSDRAAEARFLLNLKK
ncbi:MAG: hypothetical protein IM516_00155 [Pseudanabaena sp. M158S2SP1A06QC]|jgi:hypothetical protein|nr:hypothetical protein [Pseudanabaena sp. M051S1SP1A06QC]MCA6610530.1 hypothetical protein [Pseudanabaena sp. M158S2SP1A06QC]MCA6623349.1 hypothetical protein [Pseudanabaena sp. M165S2SP1A06QC]